MPDTGSARTPSGEEHPHDAVSFEDWVLHDQFPCVGAKSAVRRKNARLGHYGRMCSPCATEALAGALQIFATAQCPKSRELQTFVASFDPLETKDELAFEQALWRQLQLLADVDDAPWDSSVSPDPNHAAFSFSFAGRAFFVVGLHPGASRLARRFPQPCLVFNPHAQFERLRQEGTYGRMQKIIRARDAALQGDPNPMLGDFGRRSEARQYAGRQVDDEWECPFHHRSP